MRILITGGTGFIGQHLVPALIARGDSVIIWSRRIKTEHQPGVAYVQRLDQVSGTVDAVINLAGAGIADSRWSEKRKAELRASRVDLTEHLVAWMREKAQIPGILISGSAIGYYGGRLGDEILDETCAPLNDFTHRLCADWEEAALKIQDDGCRVCCIRTSVVLGQGGALKKMLLPFKLGVGGPIASGQQWFSWIHIDDEVRAILFLLDQADCKGVYNLAAPEAVTNDEFSHTLARVLKRPALLKTPEFVLKMMLGEGSEMLTLGQRVAPLRLLNSGFEFRYPGLQMALENILKD